jgi:hypothetical protein
MVSRSEVYNLIDGERAYQSKWGEPQHSIAEWLVFMESYLQEAKEIVAREGRETATPKAMNLVRKVTALGVAAMEQIPTPPR